MEHNRSYFLWGTFFMFTAVVFGAMGAHYLKTVLSESALDSFQTGVKYQLVHGLALLIVPFIIEKFELRSGRWILPLMVAGVFCFSFSIYLLSCRSVLGLGEGIKVLGPITPIGGLLLILSWGLLFFALLRKR